MKHSVLKSEEVSDLMKSIYGLVIIIVIVLFITFYLFPFSEKGDAKIKSISVEELHEKLKADPKPVLLDVRTKEEFEGPLGHLEGALHIPMSKLEASIDTLNAYKDREIIVYCRSGVRSYSATVTLTEKGFKAINLRGGILAWNRLQDELKKMEQQ